MVGLDAFQKALVMPIDACLQAIKEDLRATCVKLFDAEEYEPLPDTETVPGEHRGSIGLESRVRADFGPQQVLHDMEQIRPHFEQYYLDGYTFEEIAKLISVNHGFTAS